MEDTIFAKIIRREIPAEIVYENEWTLAFLDMKPVTRGHTLVVPKKFARNILDIEVDSLAKVVRTVQKIAQAQIEVLDAEGVNVHINNEPAAGQEVLHFHIHVIPRFRGDGLEHWHGTPYPLGGAANVANKLRSKLR